MASANQNTLRHCRSAEFRGQTPPNRVASKEHIEINETTVLESPLASMYNYQVRAFGGQSPFETIKQAIGAQSKAHKLATPLISECGV